MATRVFCNR